MALSEFVTTQSLVDQANEDVIRHTYAVRLAPASRLHMIVRRFTRVDGGVVCSDRAAFAPGDTFLATVMNVAKNVNRKSEKEDRYGLRFYSFWEPGLYKPDDYDIARPGGVPEWELFLARKCMHSYEITEMIDGQQVGSIDESYLDSLTGRSN